jgi:hypothetical protein
MKKEEIFPRSFLKTNVFPLGSNLSLEDEGRMIIDLIKKMKH